MKLYNSLTRKKEELVTIIPGEVKLYNCGPTVYNHPTLGNLRTYVTVDLLRRTLKHLGYKVIETMNITDIEDKIIRDSIKENVFYKDLTKKYEKVFLANMAELNIEKPEYMPHATDQNVINTMIKIISQLITDGYAYKSDDGSVYFSIKKFKGYGKLSRLASRTLKAGARVSQDEYEKENAQDFALWKAAKEGEPSWPSPFGIGRPGWHIECTAMSTMFLGETIDIHAGGVDLMFPHHENEIAQSEAYTGKKFVNLWFHGEHLLINGQRMGKSMGNAYTLKDACQKYRVEALAFRMLTLQSHYRERLNFTDESIVAAQKTLNNLRNVLTIASQATKKGKSSFNTRAKSWMDKFDDALADDLNAPKAVAAVFGFSDEIKKEIEAITKDDFQDIKKFFGEVDRVLGLKLSPIEIDKPVRDLFDAYLKARTKKQWEKSDEIREKISALGWLAEDFKTESRLRKK